MPIGKGSELTHVFRALAPDQQVGSALVPACMGD
jgi:hypothetical protein